MLTESQVNRHSCLVLTRIWYSPTQNYYVVHAIQHLSVLVQYFTHGLCLTASDFCAVLRLTGSWCINS